MWPFAKRETRANTSYSDEVVRLIETRATGGLIEAGALAAVEACAGLWERCLAEATVKPMSAPLRPVTAPFLALVGRGLAYRGEFVGAIEVSGDMVMALPAASWDVHGAGADPLAWRYRVDLAGPSGSITRELPAEAVLHIRLADPRTPWQGRSPLTRCKATADLAARIESSLDKEARIPPTRIAPAPVATYEQVKGYGDGLRAGGVLATFWGTGMPGGEQLPSSRWTPAKMQPEPDQVMHALRTQTGHDIANAFGVSPALFESRGDGAGQREAWRRFWAGTMQPLAMLLQDELKMKLDEAAMVTLESLRASDEDGRSRAVSRRAAAAKTLFDMGIGRDQALRLAGIER